MLSKSLTWDGRYYDRIIVTVTKQLLIYAWKPMSRTSASKIYNNYNPRRINATKQTKLLKHLHLLLRLENMTMALQK